MAADNPPQYLWFPFKGFICCKHFLDEICHEGDSWCKTRPWSITELVGPNGVWRGSPPRSAPPAAHRAPRRAWLKAATWVWEALLVAAENLSQRRFPGLGNCRSAPSSPASFWFHTLTPLFSWFSCFFLSEVYADA